MNNRTDRGKDNLVKKSKLQCKKVQSEKNLKNAHGITLVALVITIVLNCCRSGRNHIKETNLKNILEKRINLL